MSTEPGEAPPPFDCSFYLRRPAQPNGSWTYHLFAEHKGAYGESGYVTTHPPIPGDLVFLTPPPDLRDEALLRAYRVLERDFLYPYYGSKGWRSGTKHPTDSIHMQVVVEETEGLFRNQASLPDDPDDDGSNG